MRMAHRLFPYIFNLALISCIFTKVNAQAGLCPTNLDIEQGNFGGWTGYTGTAGVYPLPTPGIVPGRHTIIDAATSGLDPYGFFPELCPNGSSYSVKLGNSATGAQAESISFTYTIPSTVSTFSMMFYYAIVLENPAGHSPSQQPRFRARIKDAITGLPVPCVDFDFISGSSTGGFRASTVNPSVLYKDWTPISINLNAYIGRTIMLEFITEDCTLTGHFGYAYFDVGTMCSGAITGNFICPGENSITLTAPFGFASYRWFDDIACTNVVGTNQTLTLSPPPAVGSIYPVEITPFPGFGCLDTLYAIVDVGTTPAANAGADKIICNGQLVQIGGPPLIAHGYSWSNGGFLDNPNIANPMAGPVPGPTTFTLTVTDLLTGCTNTDDVIVDNFLVDTLVTTNGNINRCIGEPAATLSVKNNSTSVQWYEQTTGLIPGATGINFSPTITGIYWAAITQGGCPDSTGEHAIYVHPLPTASFTSNNDTGCVVNNTFTFTNTSTPNNPGTSWLWRYSDGVTDISMDASRTFSRVGTYNVKLITTSEFGCKDSTTVHPFYVMTVGTPDFTWDSICTTRPMTFTNLSNENGSPQTWYSWDFGNGDPISLLKDPPMVTYTTQPGKLDVILKMTSLGCESDTQTIVKTVQVNRQAPGVTYRSFTIPQGSSKWLHVRDTIGDVYLWRPQIQLSSYNTQYTQFFATGDDVLYHIDITDEHTCVTTDTMFMQVLKKPGYYLPTAFTPNGDGLNDLARPYLVGMKGLKSFSIFNRAGQRLYHTRTEGQGWDGKFGGTDQGNGVFIWVLEFYDADNKLVLEKGTITLIR